MERKARNEMLNIRVDRIGEHIKTLKQDEIRQAAELRHLLVEAADEGTPASELGQGPVLHEPALEVRDRRQEAFRPRPRMQLRRPYPPPRARRQDSWPLAAYGCGLGRALAG